MKRTIAILALAAAGMLLAGPAAWADTATNRPPTEITSDHADFDLHDRQATYRGHVYVNDPEVKLRCELLTVQFPEHGRHLTHVQAETNVVIDFIDQNGQTNHLTAGRAVYAYKVENSVTNETVTFTGNPLVETTEATIAAEPMVWDRASGHLHFTNPHMISRQGLSGGSGTNGAALKLF
jgi:lipopolysaccharide transport protein LptA